MPACAPRISPRLVAALVRLDDERVPIAETCRRVCAEAERIGVARPSYQRLRELVHSSRRIRRSPSTGSVLVDVVMRVRPPQALVDGVAGAD